MRKQIKSFRNATCNESSLTQPMKPLSIYLQTVMAWLDEDETDRETLIYSWFAVEQDNDENFAEGFILVPVHEASIHFNGKRAFVFGSHILTETLPEYAGFSANIENAIVVTPRTWAGIKDKLMAQCIPNSLEDFHEGHEASRLLARSITTIVHNTVDNPPEGTLNLARMAKDGWFVIPPTGNNIVKATQMLVDNAAEDSSEAHGSESDADDVMPVLAATIVSTIAASFDPAVRELIESNDNSAVVYPVTAVDSEEEFEALKDRLINLARTRREDLKEESTSEPLSEDTLQWLNDLLANF